MVENQSKSVSEPRLQGCKREKLLRGGKFCGAWERGAFLGAENFNGPCVVIKNKGISVNLICNTIFFYAYNFTIWKETLKKKCYEIKINRISLLLLKLPASEKP